MGVDRNLQISHSFAMSQSQGLAFPDQKKEGGAGKGKKALVYLTLLIACSELQEVQKGAESVYMHNGTDNHNPACRPD